MDLKSGVLVLYWYVLLWSSVIVDWYHVQKIGHVVYYISFSVWLCQTTWFGKLSICSTEGNWAGRGIEDRELHDVNNVKEVSRLRETPCGI